MIYIICSLAPPPILLQFCYGLLSACVLTKGGCHLDPRLHIAGILRLLQLSQWGWGYLLEANNSHYIYRNSCKLALTPSQDKVEPPLFGELAKNNHQQEVEHDTLTKHPAEGSQKEIVQEGCHKCTTTLHDGR